MRNWTKAAAMLAGGAAIALAAASPAFAAGTAWQVDPSPQPTGSTSTGLTGVFAASATEAWAVGQAGGTGSGALIDEWNGTRWGVVPGASTNSGASLSGVSGTGSDDVWAVGNQTGGILIEHWNGQSWSQVPGASNQPVGGLGVVSADSPTDAWAGGAAAKVNDPHNGGDTAVIEHWNGTQWSVVPGAIDTTGTPLSSGIISIAAISPTDVWALASVQKRGNEIEHWDGTQWSTVSLPVSTVNAISAVSADDVWAVGQDGVILNWNGTQWNKVANPASGGDENLVAVDALSASDVWTISLDGTVTEQWNGTQWNSVPPASALPGGFRVAGGVSAGNALSGRSGGPLFAVGNDSSNQSTILQQPQP